MLTLEKISGEKEMSNLVSTGISLPPEIQSDIAMNTQNTPSTTQSIYTAFTPEQNRDLETPPSSAPTSPPTAPSSPRNIGPRTPRQWSVPGSGPRTPFPQVLIADPVPIPSNASTGLMTGTLTHK